MECNRIELLDNLITLLLKIKAFCILIEITAHAFFFDRYKSEDSLKISKKEWL